MEIQPLTIADRLPWADLLAQAFDRTPLQMLDLLDWLHEHYDLIAWGAWDGPQLAAQYAVLIRDVYIPAQQNYVKVGLSLNMAVHTAYRGQGLIKQVAAPVYERLQRQGGVAGIGFSNAEGVQVDRHSKSYGYRVLGRMRSVIGWLPGPRSDSLILSDRWLTNQDCLSSDPLQRIHFRNSTDLLYRRFARHPFRRYRYGIWQTGQTTRGIIVYRPVRFKEVSGAALLAACTEIQNDLPALLARWCTSLRKVGISFVHLLTSPHSAMRNALVKSTVCFPFPLSRTPSYLTIKPLDHKMSSSLLNFAAWDCLGGDIL